MSLLSKIVFTNEHLWRAYFLFLYLIVWVFQPTTFQCGIGLTIIATEEFYSSKKTERQRKWVTGEVKYWTDDVAFHLLDICSKNGQLFAHNLAMGRQGCICSFWDAALWLKNSWYKANKLK